MYAVDKHGLFSLAFARDKNRTPANSTIIITVIVQDRRRYRGGPTIWVLLTSRQIIYGKHESFYHTTIREYDSFPKKPMAFRQHNRTVFVFPSIGTRACRRLLYVLRKGPCYLYFGGVRATPAISVAVIFFIFE